MQGQKTEGSQFKSIAYYYASVKVVKVVAGIGY